MPRFGREIQSPQPPSPRKLPSPHREKTNDGAVIMERNGWDRKWDDRLNSMMQMPHIQLAHVAGLTIPPAAP